MPVGIADAQRPSLRLMTEIRYVDALVVMLNSAFYGIRNVEKESDTQDGVS